jgi:Protein of unknown function (DUF1236)
MLRQLVSLATRKLLLRGAERTALFSVHFVGLPEDVVRIVPEYRGFDYVLVRDQILIIDPDTLEIVAIIPA